MQEKKSICLCPRGSIVPNSFKHVFLKCFVSATSESILKALFVTWTTNETVVVMVVLDAITMVVVSLTDCHYKWW